MIRSSIGSRTHVLVMVAAVAVLSATALPVAWGQATAAPAIKFLSPTSFAGEMPTLTDDGENGVNSSYRLSAWVANAPQGGLVEFELVPGDPVTKPITIGDGRQVADDTFEYHWDISEGPTGVVEGQHTLKATLYDSAGQEASVDTVEVNILHGSTPQTAEEDESAIDMTYPVSGGPLGWYRAPDGKANSVFDSKKAGTSTVQAWFTTSTPGTAPVWRLCNAGEIDRDFGDGVRCTYPADDPATKEINEAVDPALVTAVGLVLAREDGSADVVRVFPYLQDPTSVTNEVLAPLPHGVVDPANKPGSLTKPRDPNTGLFGCSDWIRMKITDQVGRSIAGANLDAHAQGPSDQLKFHTSYISATASAGYQAPNEGHSFPEPATKCMKYHDAIPQQGEHGLGGQPDRKHVETTAGTKDNGTFDFALESDQAGTTQLTVWAEEKDDDRFCTGEPSKAVALGWAEDSPSANGEQPSDCGVVVPEPDPNEEPFDGSRSAAIEPASTAVRTGRSTTIVGSIDAANQLCEAGQVLKLKVKKPSARRFRTISSATTDGFGLTSFKVKVERTKNYRVVAPAAGECALAKSTIRKIRAI